MSLSLTCNCSLGFADQQASTSTSSDGESAQRSVDVKNTTRTDLGVFGLCLPEAQPGPSSQGRVASFSQRVNNRRRSQSVPCNFPRSSTTLPSTQSHSLRTTTPIDLSLSSLLPSNQDSYGEESETDISVCETSISISTDDSINTRNSDGTLNSEPTTTDDDDASSISSKPDRFFDEDVTFPPVNSFVEAPSDLSLISEVKWDHWAKRRLVKMVEKEPCVAPKALDTECLGVPLDVKQDIITWLIDFEHGFNDYPSISLPTRHRAIILFHQFYALDRSLLTDVDRITLRAHRIGVACLTLACKTDIDFLAPLEVIPLLLWEWSVMNSGWVDICADQIGMFEQIILERLSYQVTFPTPCDFLTELLIAIPMLEKLRNHCLEDWELVEEAFSLIYEHAFHHLEYHHHRSSVLTVAILLLCLDECIFDHPREQPARLGQVWWRDMNGVWTETRAEDLSEPVSYRLCSEKEKGAWVELRAEVIKTSICEIMGLKESEVDQCKQWCAAL